MSNAFATTPTRDLQDAEFQAIREFLYRLCGINLQAGKEGLVRTRLARRLTAVGASSYTEYLEYVQSDPSGRELTVMVDSLTTNKTSFFRENQHFDYIRDDLLPQLLARGGRMRFWSAGCSSGEEPYTLAMLLNEDVADADRRDVKILATDISTRVLARASEGIYESNQVADIPKPLLKRYFVSAPGASTAGYRVGDRLRGMIRFARLNLMDEWPMRGPFDAIFCRNVMIYFDRPTQERLVNRFWELLAPGGHLFVGHSESLTALKHPFRYVQPAVYVR